ncbi:HypC/HybG/HupF family hydrogenase formation chaperone [Anaerospora sp.]|uniref:HypC/HybG/HupF family hydrogenase formation chaperone n=1 Tax=Anaerospora sp. TaxID=1960278 RepID=UPI00289CF223|nr:HypC/HybG/HupF family hydrogenase formation chaperone [Anaerospora sp.]
MCLAVPAKIVDKQDMLATIELSGVTRQVSLMLLPNAVQGEWVLVHAGFAIQLIDEAEALKTLDLFRELKLYEEA